MWILPNKCPKCFGNLVLDEVEMSLSCEDCEYHEKTKDKIAFAAAKEEAEEWGPKGKRLIPSLVGKLILNPFGGLMVYLRETLEEGVKGLDLEKEDLELLRKYNLIMEGVKEND